MTAPVNPEGQTPRDVIKAAKRLVEGKYPHWTMAGGENDCPHGYAAGIPCERCDTRLVREFDAAQPSEGQTAQEVKRAALMEGAAYLERHGFVSAKAPSPAAALRALASTPSPAATATPATTDREVVNGRGPQAQGDGGAVQANEARGGAADVSEVRPEVRDPEGAARSVHDSGGLPLVQARADRGDVAPSPAKQQEQKIADQKGGGADAAVALDSEVHGLGGRDLAPVQAVASRGDALTQGTASKLGAAPATRYLLTAAWKDGALTRMEGPRAALDDMLKWWSQNGEPVTTFIEPATAQPDARDAEIARLREERDFERGQRDLRHAAYIEERDKAAQLTKELEEARAAKAVAEKNELRSIRRTRDAEAQAKALLEALRDLFWDNFPRGVLITRAVCTAPEWRAYQLLAPPEPKAETPAETAGQKGGP